MAEHQARVETVASTYQGGRAVVELLAHLMVDGQDVAWPVAVVAESPDDLSVVFRSYCSQWPVDGRRHLRPPVLRPRARPARGRRRPLPGRAGGGDTDAIVASFAADGYFREPIGPHATHRGPAELRSFFTRLFSDGGGIGLQDCVLTDDGVRCVVEYNCVRWGCQDLPPQAGLGVFERSPDGRLAAVRVYDDVEPPPERPERPEAARLS